MTALSGTIAISRTPALHFSSGSSLKSIEQCVWPTKFAFTSKNLGKPSVQRRAFTVKASYRDGGRSNSTSIFVGGFVVGGLIAGTLGFVYAPQISNALTGANLTGASKKDLMKKLPTFLYDEEKALEKQRKKLAQKIEQLNSAIDNASNQLRSEENEAAVSSDDIEALV